MTRRTVELLRYLSEHSELISIRLGPLESQLTSALDEIERMFDSAAGEQPNETVVDAKLRETLRNIPFTDYLLREFDAMEGLRGKGVPSTQGEGDAPLVGRPIRQRCQVLVRRVLTLGTSASQPSDASSNDHDETSA